MKQYEDLIEKIEWAPGREEMELLEMLVKAADAENDTQMAYDARYRLSESACNEGFPEKAIVAFSWCLMAFDKDPQLDHWENVLWRYKTMLELIPIFTRVSKKRIVEMQEDMARRLQGAGESDRTANYYRSWNYMRMGDYEQSLQYQDAYLAMKRSGISDCLACERDRQVELLSRMKHDEDSLKLAEPILSGSMGCSEVPEFTNAHIVRSLIRNGRIDEAAARQKTAYEQVRNDRKYLGTIGDLMLALIRKQNHDTAAAQMIRHLPWAAETKADELRFRFYDSCSLLLESISQTTPNRRKLRLPEELECWREDETYDPRQLGQWFANESRQIADLFNERNGNQRYDEMIADNRQLAGLQ